MGGAFLPHRWSDWKLPPPRLTTRRADLLSCLLKAFMTQYTKLSRALHRSSDTEMMLVNKCREMKVRPYHHKNMP